MTIRCSAVPVLGENVIARLHHRVARVAALGITRLRRTVSQSASPERVGGGGVLELGISPSTAGSEPHAVLQNEIHVVLSPRRRWLAWVRFLLFWVPIDFRHHGTVREWLAVAGHARLEGVDHDGIPQDRGDLAAVLTDGNDLPAFVSSELSEGEPARHFQSVLVLRALR